MRSDAESTAPVEDERSHSGRGLLLTDGETVRSFPHAALEASLWRYYVAATSTDPVDITEIEHDRKSGAPAAALVAADGPDGVAFFGKAATFELVGGISSREIAEAGRNMAEALRDRAQESGRGMLVRVIGESPDLSGFERVLLDAGASASLEFSAEANLALPEEELWTSLRKSYRSLINAGRRELSIEVVDEAAPNRQRFEAYRSLHRDVAGRVTRPADSWNIMFELLTKGRAQLVLANLRERTVAATYLIRFGSLAIYASGAYARDLGKFPVSHWPVYASMLAAKRSGVERLVVGSIALEYDSHTTPKERSIGVFKTGFATEVRAYRTYRIPSK